MRILLVDDDEGFRATLWRLLTRGGRAVRVEEAADGEEALQIVANRRPDVVVMDLTMPRMNGIEATRRLKVRWPDLPVIILTVHDDPVYERTARAAGADGFLAKKTAGTALWPALTALAREGPATGREGAPGPARRSVTDPSRTSRPGTRGDSPGSLGDRPDWQACWRPL
jgi:two-component system response regulator MprA